MSDVASPVPQGYSPNPGTPQKGWFGRNWLWFVPVIIIVPIILCCGGCSLLTYFTVKKGMDMVMNNDAFKDAITMMENNEDVKKEIGTPMEVPGMVEIIEQGGTLEFNQSGSGFSFEARVPVSGPDGSGWLVVDAEDSSGNGSWTYREVYFETRGGDEIDLQATGSGDDADEDEDSDADVNQGDDE